MQVVFQKTQFTLIPLYSFLKFYRTKLISEGKAIFTPSFIKSVLDLQDLCPVKCTQVTGLTLNSNFSTIESLPLLACLSRLKLLTGLFYPMARVLIK